MRSYFRMRVGIHFTWSRYKEPYADHFSLRRLEIGGRYYSGWLTSISPMLVLFFAALHPPPLELCFDDSFTCSISLSRKRMHVYVLSVHVSSIRSDMRRLPLFFVLSPFSLSAVTSPSCTCPRNLLSLPRVWLFSRVYPSDNTNKLYTVIPLNIFILRLL
jgi:hypothetical protein